MMHTYVEELCVCFVPVSVWKVDRVVYGRSVSMNASTI